MAHVTGAALSAYDTAREEGVLRWMGVAAVALVGWAWLAPVRADACSVTCEYEEFWRLELVSVEIVDAGDDTDADTDPPEWPSQGTARASGSSHFYEPDTGNFDSDVYEGYLVWTPPAEEE